MEQNLNLCSIFFNNYDLGPRQLYNLIIVKTFTKKFSGFTLIEMMVVIAILAIITVIAMYFLSPAELIQRHRYAATRASLLEMADAAKLYEAEYGHYPPDVNRNIPEEFVQYLTQGTYPNGPFPGSVYDWDNWSNQTCWDGSKGIVQVTLRQINDYKGKPDYTIYYVIQGSGIPHCSDSQVKGECVNCTSRYP